MKRAWPAVLCCTVALATEAGGPVGSPARERDSALYSVPLEEAKAPAPSELESLVERYGSDRAAYLRLWSVPGSAARREKLRGFYRGWQAQLARLDAAKLSTTGRVDHALLAERLEYELGLLAREETLEAELAPLVPFAPMVARLHESRRMLEPVDGAASARTLETLASAANETAKKAKAANPKPNKALARRAALRIADLDKSLDEWFKHYDGYDPRFSWWTREPMKQAKKAMADLAKVLREEIVGHKPGEEEPIVGDPIGRAALLADLAHERIPYTPEELIQVAEREFAWCAEEMKKASREMGFGDDWKRALEKVRGQYVEPGGQTERVRQLALEAIAFVQDKNLVTVPTLAADVWRMEMLSPERQKVAPFFLGGETILVAYPTDGMSQEDKLNSLRANNWPFSRAVVHHELIPGHHLQQFMNERYASHRRAFRTPFWGEGWALYWEFLLWDNGFPRTPEDRVGMLFWRMHRCARILFSLNFHLGHWTPQQSIDFLVDRVGHERWTATGEVRRSFAGDYSPLYQAAYMLGGLQFYALHEEVVGSGRMTDREFHDRILREGPIPVELVRAIVTDTPPAPGAKPAWRFADR
ncbi:MAG: DUF885 domain-containing protein [Vicinamibacteria bacterium]|nr:DUF885 domain-containing protein [Vicinamibacteria bacterium]